jgi:hypothetical protein
MPGIERYDKEKKRGKRAKVRFARERDDLDTKSINSATDSVISKISVNSRYNQTVKKNKVHHLDRDFYMTPRATISCISFHYQSM